MRAESRALCQCHNVMYCHDDMPYYVTHYAPWYAMKGCFTWMQYSTDKIIGYTGLPLLAWKMTLEPCRNRSRLYA